MISVTPIILHMGISCTFPRSSVKQVFNFRIGISYNEYSLLPTFERMQGGSLILGDTSNCSKAMLLPAWVLTTNPRSFERESELRGGKKKRFFCFTTVTFPQRNPSSSIPNGDLLFLKLAIAKKPSWISAVSVCFMWNYIQTLRGLEQELLHFTLFYHEMTQENGPNIWTLSL